MKTVRRPVKTEESVSMTNVSASQVTKGIRARKISTNVCCHLKDIDVLGNVEIPLGIMNVYARQAIWYWTTRKPAR